MLAQLFNEKYIEKLRNKDFKVVNVKYDDKKDKLKLVLLDTKSQDTGLKILINSPQIFIDENKIKNIKQEDFKKFNLLDTHLTSIVIYKYNRVYKEKYFTTILVEFETTDISNSTFKSIQIKGEK